MKNMISDHTRLLELLVSEGKVLASEEFKLLLSSVENVEVLAKRFLLEGVPFVFKDSPMKYLIFREQVADRFEIGYRDVCIVGSAKMGFSLSPAVNKFGSPFSQESDVDVVVVSDQLFNSGTHELFKHLMQSEQPRSSDNDVRQDAIRNFVFQNFNPALLPFENRTRMEIFSNITSTSALFLALQPQVFVSRIRCRVFKNWRAVESYYANSLRLLKRSLVGSDDRPEHEVVETDSAIVK